VKVALRSSNAKRLYMDEKCTETGETKETYREEKQVSKDCAATLSDLFPTLSLTHSTCLTLEALSGV